MADEIALRQERLERLAEAKKVLQARAQERQAAEQAEYEAKQRAAREKAKRSGRKPPGRPPTPPSGEPQDKDQYNFTDPESRIMKCSSSAGFEQAYNAQVAVDQDSFLIVACSLSNHPNDKAEAEPTLAALPPATWAQPTRRRWTTASGARRTSPLWKSATSSRTLPPAASRITRAGKSASPPNPSRRPRMPVRRSRWPTSCAPQIGQAIYRLRKCTVEPVIGIIKAVLGFRQFSLRGLDAADGEWALVCLAFNLKRMHTLSLA